MATPVGTSDQEAYLDIALGRWLPLAPANQLALHSAEKLAVVLEREQGDVWLRDALREAAAHPASWSGFALLQLAIEKNNSGQPRHGLLFARRAARLFAVGANRPAWLRAKWEEVYALHRLVNGRDCYREGTVLRQAIRGKSYRWIEIQTDLEVSVCATMLGELSQAREPLNHARAIMPSGYADLELRAIGLSAAFETVSGNTAAAWPIDRSGLARFFAGDFKPQRGYQFYSDLSFIAQRAGRWHLATALADEAERMITGTTNKSMSIMAMYRHGVLANAAGLSGESEAAFSRAAELFTEPPVNDEFRIYRTDGEVTRAAIEVSLGRMREAKSHLDAAAQQLDRITNVTTLFRYYQALGLLKAQQDDIEGAESAFRKAISFSQAGFSLRRTASERAAWAEETGRAYKGLTELLLRRRGLPGAALDVWNEFRRGVLHPDSNLRAEALRRGPDLPSRKDPVVLTYSVFPEGVAIWLLDGRKLSSYWTNVAETDLNDVVTRFARECSDLGAPPSAMLRDGALLYQYLIHPVESFLDPGRSILIEPDAVISQVPFAALPDPNSVYFGGRYPLAISLGTSSGPLPSAISNSSRILIVGSPALKGESTQQFPPSADALREARTIAGLFKSPTLLTNGEATHAAVRKALPTSEVFHFAGHAISDWSGGSLLLSDPSGIAALGSAELEKMPLRRCRLAILSACSTAEGDNATHSEGLAGAFLRAGVGQVVAVRWQIDSAAARVFAETLYRLLLKRLPLDRALQEAAATVRSRSETAHPAFWAGFQAYEATSPPRIR